MSDHALEEVPYLLYEKEDNGILWIKFNRPERLNACIGGNERFGTLAKVGEYMRAADDDPDIRVIVQTGVGRGFCSGADLKERPSEDEIGPNVDGARGLHEGPDAMRQHFYHGFTKLHRDIRVLRKPTIATINGAAVGSGMDSTLTVYIRLGYGHTPLITSAQAALI